MNLKKITSMFVILVLMINILSILSISTLAENDSQCYSTNDHILSIPEITAATDSAEQVTPSVIDEPWFKASGSNEQEPEQKPEPEQKEKEKHYGDIQKKVVDASANFSPIRHTRISEYRSHLITEQEVLDMKSKVGVRAPGKNYNLLFNGLGTGLAPPTEQEWSAMVGNIEVVDEPLSAALPASLDHSTSPYFPPVRSQASQGSCAAWATTYYAATYVQAKDNGWTQASAGNNNQIMSPAWSYNKVNSGHDSGSWTWTNYYLLRDIGGVTWTNMPYNEFDNISWGSEAAWRQAPKYRLGDFKWTSPKNIDVLKSWLNDGYVLPMALDAGEYSALGTGDDTISSNEYSSSTSNHANTIVGYDDTKEADGDLGAFKIVNSWGSSWGSSWGGNGYYWMTYKAFAELLPSVIICYDKVDYEPALVTTWNFTQNCSRDADITVGFGNPANPDDSIVPYLLGGLHNYPNFMCLDITEFQAGIGLNTFFLEVDSGVNNTYVSSFKLELYKNGYLGKSPSLISNESTEVPKMTPCVVTNSFLEYYVSIDTPKENDWYAGNLTCNGSANASISKIVLFEDFETEFPGDWVVGDSNILYGADYWGTSTSKFKNGSHSGWCAAVQEPIFEQDFDLGGSSPSGWTTFSANTTTSQPWALENDGYEFLFDTDDYAAVCDSDAAGPGTNITEWLYTNTSFNASQYTNLYLEFLLIYDYYDGDEYAQVLFANGSSYPNFMVLRTWTTDTAGMQWINLSSAAGENEVYIAFRYHGTYDYYMLVDDVGVFTNSSSNKYDPNINAYVYHSVELAEYDSIDLSYDYWLDSEQNSDKLYAIYFSGGSWTFLDEHNGTSNGWNTSNLSIPNTTTHIGFIFFSDSSGSDYEGAYLDNIRLVGYSTLQSIELFVGSSPWLFVNGTTSWNITINTTKYSDGLQDISVRARYGYNYSYADSSFKVDNTPPNAFTPTANPPGWTDNKQPVITFSTTDTSSGMWQYKVKVDTGGFSTQISPYTLPAQTDGIHTVTIRAFDQLGNYRDEYVNVYINTSSHPNPFTPTAAPSSWTNNTQPVITFSTIDTVNGMDHYEVKVDTGGFSTQVSPYTLPTLTDGVHTITVRAFNTIGNYRDGFVSVYIDTERPLVFIPTSGAAEWTNNVQSYRP